MVVAFDSAILNITASTDVEAMQDGFISAINIGTAGQVNVAGFDPSGKGPSTDLGLFQIKFTALGRGTTTIGITVNTLADTKASDLGTTSSTGGTITVN